MESCQVLRDLWSHGVLPKRTQQILRTLPVQEAFKSFKMTESALSGQDQSCRRPYCWGGSQCSLPEQVTERRRARRQSWPETQTAWLHLLSRFLSLHIAQNIPSSSARQEPLKGGYQQYWKLSLRSEIKFPSANKVLMGLSGKFRLR